jgi:excisionase family DNA binding protein
VDLIKEQYLSLLLSRKEAAIYLNVSERWMYRAKEHGIPFHKIGKWVYFTKADLDSYIAKHRIGGDVK